MSHNDLKHVNWSSLDVLTLPAQRSEACQESPVKGCFSDDVVIKIATT